jgi:hypothetical protein
MIERLGGLLAVSLLAMTVGNSGLRRPQGLYARVNPTALITHEGDWTGYFTCYFAGLIENPDISGIQLALQWRDISSGPRAEDNDWRYSDAAFNAVHEWNGRHPDNRKSIQLIVTPGFESPDWLLEKLASCDSFIANNSSMPFACGKITIEGYKEAGNTATIWPLPWDPTYKEKWATFLRQLDTRYGNREELVSITMGGPTAASTEMFVPNDNPTNQKPTPRQHYGEVSIPANKLMKKLIHNWSLSPSLPPPPYKVTPDTDDVFVSEWHDTVATYAGIFQNLTLILTPASGHGYPDLNEVTDGDSLEGMLCAKSPTEMSCATTAAIMEDFMNTTLARGNGKGSQVSGLKEGQSKEPADFGIDGVHYLANYTANQSVTDQIIGGAQFDHAFTEVPNLGGCAKGVTCSPAQAEYNTLRSAFDQTAAACFFDDSGTIQDGGWPLNFLQIYAQDFLYANEHACPRQRIETGSGHISESVQDLFDQAAVMIDQVSQIPPPAVSCAPSLGSCVQPPPPPVCSPPPIGCDPECVFPTHCDPTTHQCVCPPGGCEGGGG